MEIWKKSAQQDRLPTGKFGRNVWSGISGSKLVDSVFVTEVSSVSKGEPGILYKSTPCWLIGQRTLAVPAVAAAHLNFYPEICWKESKEDLREGAGGRKQEGYCNKGRQGWDFSFILLLRSKNKGDYER